MSPSNASQVEQLNPVTFPLYGSRLIEASAGTGKTFTIALLYVRLVLGNNQAANAFPPPLTPEQILVVTFTELAAGELRDRIRARLVEAAEYFLQPELDDDKLLTQLRNEYPATSWTSCAWRLQTASQNMDEASVSTIHSWCNRMLVEHAFDSRGLFDREMVTDSGDLLTEVVEDYWRKHFYQLDSEQARELTRVFASPAQLRQRLYSTLQPTNKGVSFKGQPVTPSPALWQQCLEQQQKIAQQKQDAEKTARQEWAQNWDSISAHLMQLQPHLNGSTHGSAKTDKFAELLEQIHLWATTDAKAPSKLSSFASGSFKFKTSAKIKQEDPLPAFECIRRMNEAAQLEPTLSLSAAVLADAAHWVRNEFSRRMQQNAHMGFDDLLVQLERALNPAISGIHAEQMAATLKRSFPVAMIDEFQDTDPIQYGIFDHIYQVASNPTDCGIFMIGDPKQSIYAFRGADINTYLQVRTDTRGRHYTLKKNFRSTLGVVQACNQFFSFAEQHPGAAFRYQQDEQENPLPFIQVDAQGRNQQLILHGQPANPMTLWHFQPNEPGKPLAMKDFRQQAAQVAASQIADWLRAAAQQQAGFIENGTVTTLQPADIAILVRSGSEAQLIQHELSARCIYSVYLSDRESIFASQQAADCLHWLRACAEPSNEQLVKAALATLSLQLPLTQLAAWQEDELVWEQQMLQFTRLHHIWRKQGVLVMLHRLQEYHNLPARLLRQPDGERALTNLLHLGEWLQEAASQLDGAQALIRHLAEHLDSQDEQQLLRLESDAQRVKILTIHKSKGLEYPLVLLPFISAWSTGKRQPQVPYRIQQELHTEVADSKTFASAWQAADEERLREDLRLLYVAMTRASHALWLGIGPLADAVNSKTPSLHKGAMGHILNGGQAFADAAAVQAAVDQLVKNSDICLLPAPTIDHEPAPKPAATPLENARTAPKLNNLYNWWIASYSALQFAGQKSDNDLAADEPDSARDDQVREHSREQPAQTHSPVSGSTKSGSLHRFPRGAKWGTFLHSLLEWAAKTSFSTNGAGRLDSFAAALADQQGREKMLRQRCKLHNIEDQFEPLNSWLESFIEQPWPARFVSSGFTLAQLTPDKLAIELEFLLEVHHVSVPQLDQLIRPHTLQGGSAPEASPKQLNGLLKGFIDLVFEHDGRYYLVDWKSNRLGDDDSAYSHDNMLGAILQYRYDMQYMLYILALHRQLRARLPDYDYEQHMGGAIYSFVRGWRNPETQGLYHDCPPKALIEKLDRLFSQAKQGEQA